MQEHPKFWLSSFSKFSITKTTFNFTGGGGIFLKHFTPKRFPVFFENGEKMKKDEV